MAGRGDQDRGNGRDRAEERGKKKKEALPFCTKEERGQLRNADEPGERGKKGERKKKLYGAASSAPDEKKGEKRVRLRTIAKGGKREEPLEGKGGMQDHLLALLELEKGRGAGEGRKLILHSRKQKE